MLSTQLRRTVLSRVPNFKPSQQLLKRSLSTKIRNSFSVSSKKHPENGSLISIEYTPPLPLPLLHPVLPQNADSYLKTLEKTARNNNLSDSNGTFSVQIAPNQTSQEALNLILENFGKYLGPISLTKEEKEMLKADLTNILSEGPSSSTEKSTSQKKTHEKDDKKQENKKKDNPEFSFTLFLATAIGIATIANFLRERVILLGPKEISVPLQDISQKQFDTLVTSTAPESYQELPTDALQAILQTHINIALHNSHILSKTRKAIKNFTPLTTHFKQLARPMFLFTLSCAVMDCSVIYNSEVAYVIAHELLKRKEVSPDIQEKFKALKEKIDILSIMTAKHDSAKIDMRAILLYLAKNPAKTKEAMIIKNVIQYGVIMPFQIHQSDFASECTNKFDQSIQELSKLLEGEGLYEKPDSHYRLPEIQHLMESPAF